MARGDTIDFEEPKHSTCDCCGQRSTRLVRFVNRDDSAFAVYMVDFAEGHDFVNVLASFGGWGDDHFTPADRTAFALRIWVHEEQYQVGLVDGEKSMYAHTDYFGRILTRDEALQHPLKQELFDMSDHIMECDEPVIAFINARA